MAAVLPFGGVEPSAGYTDLLVGKYQGGSRTQGFRPARSQATRDSGEVSMARGQSGDADTASKVLDVAERLVQVNGFNGFSYADAASELGITKAALHYHFAGKAELGEALITRYPPR